MTRRSPARPAAMVAAGLAAATVMMTPVGCGVPRQERASFVPDDQVPFGLLGTASTSTTIAVAPAVPVCFVRGDRLDVVDHPLSPPVNPERLLQAAAEPLPHERAAGLSTALSDDVVVGATTADGTATVTLSPELSNLSADVQLLAVAQSVCTLTAQPGTTQVRFVLDGAPIEVPRGDGSSTSDPVVRDDYAQLLP